MNSIEYTKKIKQKTFRKLSDSDQKKWFNQKFYEYFFSVEYEKLFYYSLVYNQNTLIVSAPDENKEQEKFLGYKWSNRKGQEGIQIIKAGGCLYNAFDRGDNNSIAGLIRNAFINEEEFDVEELNTYYYRLRLQDMIDFSGTTFNKSIKTTPTRVLKDIPGLTNYRLSDKKYFDLSIGNRVLSDEVVENGSIPIYSANVFEEFGRIDKQNITDFSVPSILWGIDGDWMVNILPANKPFYPTDHCGVLRIKTNDIVPKYMLLALQVEGEFERFSRSNRASTQRISNLIIQVPSVSEQQKVVDEIETIDKRITEQQVIITEQSEKVKSKFVEMFVGKSFTFKSIKKISKELFAGGDKPDDFSLQYSEIYKYPVFSNGKKGNDLLCYSKEYRVSEPALTISARGTIGYTAIREAYFTPVVRLITLIPTDEVNLRYLQYCINNLKIEKNGSGAGQLTVPDFSQYEIMVPPKPLQIEFENFVKVCDKLKFEAQKSIEKYFVNRNGVQNNHIGAKQIL